jgi:hypothetical protein
MRVISYSVLEMIVTRNKGAALQQQPVKPDIYCAPVTASNYSPPTTNLIFSIFFIIYSSLWI